MRAIFDVDPGFIEAQIDTLYDDLAIDAVKIGMLSRPEVIEVVADRLAARGARNLVLDPVMVAKSGDRLLRDEAVAALRETLLPLADVVTPNLPEAAVLLGREELAQATDMTATARAILDLGAEAVLLKGGHLEGAESGDLFTDGVREQVLSAPRIATKNTHGTGCTLSSAIAAHLALGHSMIAAIEGAKAYVSRAIAAADRLTVGSGHGPVHHFHAFWPDEGS